MRWSRLSQPHLHSWSEKDEPLRLQELVVNKNDPDPNALACYGMFSAEGSRMHLRFVSGCPVSQVTTDFLERLCKQVQTRGKQVLVLFWDNASQAGCASTIRQCCKRLALAYVVFASFRAGCRLKVPGSTRLSRSGSIANERLSSRRDS